MDYIHNPYETQVDVTLIRRIEHEQFTVEGHSPHNRGLSGHRSCLCRPSCKTGTRPHSRRPQREADIRKMQDMIALNVTALTRLSYAAAPAFVKRGTGTIINIGSAAGISVEALNGVYGASKAYVLAFSLSLQHELTSKGIRVQVVLPARTATDGWDVAGSPWQKMPPEIVMPVEDMVDAALVGLDQGELVTIPPLHNGDDWTRFEAARRSMSPQFGTSVPAPRYRN